MQCVADGEFPGKSTFTFLPMIDLNPSDPSCIYSTLHFVAEQAEKYRCMPIITFDQPLWWKATKIVDNEPVGSKIKNTVLRLGGFHCQMSFLGCMRKLMGGSGIENILDVANFAQNAIPYILSEKLCPEQLGPIFLLILF